MADSKVTDQAVQLARDIVPLLLAAAGVPPPLTALIVALAPYGVEIVEAAVPALEKQLERFSHPTLEAVSKEIIDGINEMWPDWPPEQRARYAADAIAEYGHVKVNL